MVERSLFACPACGRQYDVTGIAPGARLRCECGARPPVRASAAHAPRSLNCPGCGAAFEAGARACGYCGSEITLEEKRLGSVCPKCFARLASDAQFCAECGIPIAPQAIAAVVEGSECPRCGGGLRPRSVGIVSMIECESCGGLWLPAGLLGRLCDEAETQRSALQWLERRPAPALPEEEQQPVVYLQCLRCGDRMVRRNFGGISGVILDECRSHGLWLDHSELAKILRFVRGGGLSRAREREIERERDELARVRNRRLSARRDPDVAAAWTLEGADELDLGAAVTHVARVFQKWLRRG